MPTNVAFSIGNLALIEKADGLLDGYLNRVFGPIKGRAWDFVPSIKMLMYNRMGMCLALNHFDSYPKELYDMMGFEDSLSNRTFYRSLERIGMHHQFILDQHQREIEKHGLLSDIQFVDFSSSYFEGRADALGARGYSRDHVPQKKQLTFGISTGLNGIPTALTIQKGNVQDRKHIKLMLKAAKAILEAESLLIFDCGANSKKNKREILELGFNYFTLMAKKVGPYRNMIELFLASDDRIEFMMNDRHYTCVKVQFGEETKYIFHSEQLKEEQLRIKNQKFQREIERNDPILKRTLKGKPLGQYPCKKGTVISKGILQQVIDEVPNPHINGLEGFFILECSLDVNPERILWLYKNRDKAEKLIRDIKEGTELRPIRHWSKEAIYGYVIVAFLTNFFVQLTLLKAENPLVKNLKLLKKFLSRSTVTVVYPPSGFKFSVLANISDEIRSILGDFIDKYQDKSLKLRW